MRVSVLSMPSQRGGAGRERARKLTHVVGHLRANTEGGKGDDLEELHTQAPRGQAHRAGAVQKSRGHPAGRSPCDWCCYAQLGIPAGVSAGHLRGATRPRMCSRSLEGSAPMCQPVRPLLPLLAVKILGRRATAKKEGRDRANLTARPGSWARLFSVVANGGRHEIGREGRGKG